MKKLTAFLIALLALFTISKVHAIIFVADDFIIYDTGCLADTSVSSKFSFDDATNVSLFTTDNVKINLNLKWGRGIKDVEAMGFPIGYPYQAGSTVVGAIQIAQNNKAPYTYVTEVWKDLEGEAAADTLNYRWWFNKPENLYSRPSDSLVIRVSSDIDSILIEGLGTNTGYGIIVYELDGGFDNGLYSAGNYGQNFARIGFKPVNYGNKDSVDIVVLGVFKDWFIPLTSTEWTDKGSPQFTTIKISEAENYNKGERYGKFNTATINRIKVFGEIQKQDPPAYEGLLSAWSFAYMPLPTGTGTPNVNDLAPDDGSTTEAGNKLASDLGCIRSLLSVAPGMEMELGKECGDVQNVKVADIGCNDTLYSSWGQYDKYFQVELNTLGYNNITLDFSFNLRGSSDNLAVIYSTDATNYFLAGKFATTDEYDGLVDVSVSLPLSNCATARIRFVPDYTEEGDGYPSDGELVLANLSIKGDIAANLLYIHRDSKADDIYPLFSEYISTLVKSTTYSIDADFWQTDSLTADSMSINALMAPYDIIVIGNAVEAGNSYTPALKYLLGNKPIFNMSYEVYKAWSWANITSGNNKESSETFASIDNAYLKHPIFAGLDVVDNRVTLFDQLNSSELVTIIDTTWLNDSVSVVNRDTTIVFNGVQGFESSTAICGGNMIAASGEMVVMHEINNNPAAKYLMIGTSKTNQTNLSADAKLLFVNAVDYLLSNEAFGNPDAIKKNEMLDQLTVFSQNGLLYIQTEQAAPICIYNIFGQKISELNAKEGLNSIAVTPGIYLVSCGNKALKVLVK